MLFDLPYQMVLSGHIAAMLASILFVVVADILGFLWWLGQIPKLSYKIMNSLHWLVTAGLAFSILTGTLMASTAWSYLLTQPAFVIKLVLVLTLSVNAVVIHHHLKLATEVEYCFLDKRQKNIIIISGLVSTFAWISVLITSQLYAL